MSTVLIFLAVLGFLVVAHELGHFTVAKLARVRVLEFGIGYPPRIFSFTRGDTTYSLNLLPLGGYVRMLGEEDPTHPESFARSPALTRLAVLVAGPAMNAVLPVLLLTVVFTVGQTTPMTDVVVLDVAEGSPAATAGIAYGDIIREAAGREINSTPELQQANQRRLSADSELLVERGGRLIQLTVPDVRIDPPDDQGAMGIQVVSARVSVTRVSGGSAIAAGLQAGDLLLYVQSTVESNGVRGQPMRQVLNDGDAERAVTAAFADAPGAGVEIAVMRAGVVNLLILPAAAGELSGVEVVSRPDERHSQPVWAAVPASVQQIWDVLLMTKNELSRWIAGAGSVQLSGPVGIARITGEVAGAGLNPLFTWTAILSINLAIVNLLPIPALDGGRITFVLLELARGGRRLAPDRERMVHLVGFAFLIAVIVLVSINDIRRLIGGDSIFGT